MRCGYRHAGRARTLKRDGKHILAMHDACVYATYPTGVQSERRLRGSRTSRPLPPGNRLCGVAAPAWIAGAAAFACHMFGQFAELPPPVDGAVGVVGAGVVAVGVLVVEVPDAAFAIAAPPPLRAPTTPSVRRAC